MKKKQSLILWIGFLMASILIASAIFAPLLTSYDPLSQDLYNFLKPPSSEHWFGTDALGRDLFSRVLYAGRSDLLLMVLAEVIPFIVGTALGMASGYFGGKVDFLIGLLCDTFVAFPFYLLVIVIAFLTGQGVKGIFVTYMLVGWLVYCKVARGKTQSLSDVEWVQSAKIMGYSHARILFREIFPNVLPQSIVVLMSDMTGLLVIIVTLGYLGIGITAPTPDWGTMISEGQSQITTAWWLSVIPGIFIVYTGIALSLIGDGLSDRWR